MKNEELQKLIQEKRKTTQNTDTDSTAMNRVHSMTVEPLETVLIQPVVQEMIEKLKQEEPNPNNAFFFAEAVTELLEEFKFSPNPEEEEVFNMIIYGILSSLDEQRHFAFIKALLPNFNDILVNFDPFYIHLKRIATNKENEEWLKTVRQVGS